MCAKSNSVSISAQETTRGWGYLFFELFLLPGLLSALNGLLAVPLSSAELNFLFYSINFIVILIIFRKYLHASAKAALRSFWTVLQAAIVGLVAYEVSNYLVTHAITHFFPGFSNVNDASIAAMTHSSFPLMAIGIIFLVPLVEEVLYRGLIFKRLCAASQPAAYIVSITVFGAINVMGYVGNYSAGTLALCFVQYIPAGLWLAWTCRKADNILASAAVHAAVNAIGLYITR